PVIRRGALVGPVNLFQDPVDGHVRRSPLSVKLGDDSLEPGFDVQLYTVATKAGLPAAPLPDAKDILINFNGPPGTFPWVLYYRVLNGEVGADVFKNKIVLIGPTSAVIHDVFPTAFARGNEQMPGVEIHANVVETYVRGNYIREIPRGISTLVAAVAALIGGALVIPQRAFRALFSVPLLWCLLALLAYPRFPYFH